MPKRTRSSRSPSTDHGQLVSFGDFKMPMLQSDNWMEWKSNMGTILSINGLASYISSDTDAPMKAIVAEEKVDGKEEKEKLKRIAQWQTGDAKARTLIISAISDPETIHLRGAKTARQMWEQLCKVKEHNLQHIFDLYREFTQIKAAPGCDLTTHFSKMGRVREELRLAAGDEIFNDHVFALNLISSLSSDWKDFAWSYLVAREKRRVSSLEVIRDFTEAETLMKMTRNH